MAISIKLWGRERGGLFFLRVFEGERKSQVLATSVSIPAREKRVRCGRGSVTVYVTHKYVHSDALGIAT